MNNIPGEIMETIMEFRGGLIHRERLEKITPSLLKSGAFSILKRNMIPFSLVSLLGKEECYRLFDLISTCKCCERHQINCPTRGDLDDGLVPNYSFGESDIHKCKCPCRHYSRLICREVNDEEWSVISHDDDDELSSVSTFNPDLDDFGELEIPFET